MYSVLFCKFVIKYISKAPFIITNGACTFSDWFHSGFSGKCGAVSFGPSGITLRTSQGTSSEIRLQES